VRLADFDYELPEELIAQRPADKRHDSRMLVVSRKTGTCEIRTFPDLPGYIRPGDCLVINDTRVIPARLYGRRQGSGGHVEALLLEPLGEERWKCMLRPGRRLKKGSCIDLGAPGEGTGFEVLAKSADGTAEIAFFGAGSADLIERHGSIPLPPYIRRDATEDDLDRYQTVYAESPGAVAAPTAGLHFTPEILAAIRDRGADVATVTLHVGPGTFRPVKTERIDEHEMHEERYVLSAEAAAVVNATRENGGRVIAIGTTSVRVLESCADPATRRVVAQSGRTRLFMRPPIRPVVTDALLTNFHLPRSTLLMLVSTFSSVKDVLAAYRLAVRERFRFYSYGDCMLLV